MTNNKDLWDNCSRLSNDPQDQPNPHMPNLSRYNTSKSASHITTHKHESPLLGATWSPFNGHHVLRWTVGRQLQLSPIYNCDSESCLNMIQLTHEKFHLNLLLTWISKCYNFLQVLSPSTGEQSQPNKNPLMLFIT